MPLLLYAIGFAVCYWLFDLSWWMSLLTALAFPVFFSMAMVIIGMPIGGIAALVEKIKERRKKPYPEMNRGGAYEVVGPGKEEVSEVTKAERFIVNLLSTGICTRGDLNEQGEMLGYSKATITRALNNLLEHGEIKKIARGVYSKAASVTESRASLLMQSEAEKERKRQSNTFGVWSLVLGIIGIFVGPLAIAAIVLGALQFKRHVSKCSIAGLVLGIIGTIAWIVSLTWLGYEFPYIPPGPQYAFAKINCLVRMEYDQNQWQSLPLEQSHRI